MSSPIITPERIIAASNICRWRGWMKTRISLTRHMRATAGAILELTEDRKLALMSLVHDLHETAIVGDVPTPDKSRYMNALYHQDIQQFDTRLAHEVGFNVMQRCDPSSTALVFWQDHPTLRTADRAALIVENAHYVMPEHRDPKLPEYDEGSVWQKTILGWYETYTGWSSWAEFYAVLREEL